MPAFGMMRRGASSLQESLKGVFHFCHWYMQVAPVGPCTSCLDAVLILRVGLCIDPNSANLPYTWRRMEPQHDPREKRRQIEKLLDWMGLYRELLEGTRLDVEPGSGRKCRFRCNGHWMHSDRVAVIIEENKSPEQRDRIYAKYLRRAEAQYHLLRTRASDRGTA